MKTMYFMGIMGFLSVVIICLTIIQCKAIDIKFEKEMMLHKVVTKTKQLPPNPPIFCGNVETEKIEYK